MIKIQKKATPSPVQNYCSIYKDLPKQKTRLTAHWLKNKSGKLVRFWVQEPMD